MISEKRPICRTFETVLGGTIKPLPTIRDLAKDYVEKIVHLDAETKVVHIMGEMTFTFCVVNMLQKLSIQCVASTTRRDTIIADDGSKIPKFHFEQFRPYS